MQMPRTSDAAKELFAAVMPDDPRVVVKPMFGSLGDRIGVKVLDEAARAELAATDGAGPFGPEERPMGGYVAAPEAWTKEPERIAEWVARAFEDVSALPPKKPRPKPLKR
jgi:hypothetical protein